MQPRDEMQHATKAGGQMDEIPKSGVMESAEEHLAPNQRKKRDRSPEETDNNGNGSNSLVGKSDGNDGQKESEGGFLEELNPKQKQRLSSSDDDVLQLRDKKIKQVRLEAIFHPKFENETSEKDVRKEMLSKVGGGKGYLEVTLKHSGSLLLWSGGSRFYSKNDANNIVTLVGEFMLRRHMSIIWQISKNPNTVLECSKYDECSKYLQDHRLTLAFEVVTSILGDHGDNPKHPYLILLSVADKNTQRFYTSQQLIEFAQRFRLPHNDYWMFATQSSCQKLFQFYDDIRETGTADTVIKGLDELLKCPNIADAQTTRRICSLYPHSEFQGDILEGLVVRFVEYDEAKPNDCKEVQFFDSIKELSVTSHSNLDIMRNAKANDDSQPHMLTKCKVLESERELRACLEEHSTQHERQRLSRTKMDSRGEWDVLSCLLPTLGNANEIIDNESREIIQLIQALNKLGVKVGYKLYKESEGQVGNQEQRWVCIIHVIHDETFKKYNSIRTVDSMPLYRGFSFELVLNQSDDNDQSGTKSSLDPMAVETSLTNRNPLMLKMKFLPYMVRTFGCRNGLKVLMNSGIDGYERYTLDILQRWEISHNSIKLWQPYFYSWGMYAESVLKTQNQNNAQLQKLDANILNQTSYLKHLAEFDALYRSGQLPFTVSQEDKVQGLTIVVSMTKEDSSICADFLSSKLGIRQRYDGTGLITEVEMLSSLCGNSAICSTIVVDLQTPIKKLIKKEEYANAIYLVLFGCSQDDIDHQYELGTKDYKKVSGMAKSWGRLRCREVFTLPKMTAAQLEECQEASHLLDRLIELTGLKKEDNSPGMLVFFPAIPGSGKSSLCRQDHQCDDELKRPIVVCEGDRIKGKYWSHVLLDRLKNPESIYLADKNATPSVWDTISGICTKSNALPIPTLPDSLALSTVVVEHSGEERCYPFSLAYLAVCLLRVMMRAKETHIGKLDESSDYAMLVVVMFYSLYRGISAENIHSNNRFGMNTRKITIPFFNKTQFQELPQDLHDCLVDALHFQYSVDQKDLRVIASEEAGSSMETRIRRLISKHQTFLESMCVSESESREAFLKQLSHLSSTLTDMKSMHEIHSSIQRTFIEIASIDVEKTLIDAALQDSATDFAEVKCFLSRVGDLQSNDDRATVTEGSFVEKTHVTMAHFSQLSQRDILKEYSRVDGHTITISITGILMSETVAAFSVTLPEFLDDMQSTPSCHNNFPHVTVWVGNSESAARSNNLPDMVSKSEAIRVDFTQSIEVTGKFSFWYI